MFDSATYRARRDGLRSLSNGKALLFPGHGGFSRNYADNVFRFRQSSHLLYYTGIARENLALVIDGDQDILFGPPTDIDDVVWHGPHATLEDDAERAGIADVRDIATLGSFLKERGARYLPPFLGDIKIQLAALLGRPVDEIDPGADLDLAEAVCAQRSIKSDAEVAEMESALAITARQHELSMKATRAGVRESDVVSAMLDYALRDDLDQAYNPIVSVRGEVLHNHSYANALEPGQLLLNDSGVEAKSSYCSDITRTVPVDGRFTTKQRDVYDVVLRSQVGSIEMLAPGVSYRDVHLHACHIIAEGLIGVGLMKGNAADAVAAGAHALFFPHGLGHMIGLDVHDMEDLGDIVGYGRGVTRSEQFGLNALRLAKSLEPGFVVTIEPGIYFIPALIDRWRSDGKCREFIDFDRLDDYRDFGGIRIEDDVLVTDDGHRVLGPGIPKTADEVEAVMA